MKIEKGIPIPENVSLGKGPRYPLDEMEVGDSIFFDEPEHHFPAIRESLYYQAKKQGIRIVTRKQGKRSGLRIWRVA